LAQDYDVVLKLLFRSKSSRVVQAIAGGAVKRWLDKELPAIRNTRADLVGETAGGEIVHLEFMSENQKFFELRMADGRPFQEPYAKLSVPGGGPS